MKLFHKIDDAHAILFSKGLYRQADLYRKGSDVYAAFRGGFIRLLSASGTTIPTVSYYDVGGPNVVREGQKAPKWAGEDQE